MTPAFDVVGVGTNSVDSVFRLPKPLSSVADAGKARMTARYRFCGGQTATVVCACASLGLRSRYIGAFGSDADGQLVRQTLAERGVDAAGAVVSDGPNRHALILVDPDGRRTVVWDRPTSLDLGPDRLRPELFDARLLHVDDDDPELALAAVRLANARGMEVTTDLEQITDLTGELVAAVTFPIFEEHAPGALTGERDPERALRKLRRLTARVLCVTLGERGAVALEGDRFHVAPALAVDVVDSTGAGDVFRAGFIYGVLQGWEVPRRLRFANAAAAASCTRLGAIPSVPTLDEVNALLSQGTTKSRTTKTRSTRR